MPFTPEAVTPAPMAHVHLFLVAGPRLLGGGVVQQGLTAQKAVSAIFPFGELIDGLPQRVFDHPGKQNTF